jgi:hypothetical protein
MEEDTNHKVNKLKRALTFIIERVCKSLTRDYWVPERGTLLKMKVKM